MTLMNFNYNYPNCNYSNYNYSPMNFNYSSGYSPISFGAFNVPAPTPFIVSTGSSNNSKTSTNVDYDTYVKNERDKYKMTKENYALKREYEKALEECNEEIKNVQAGGKKDLKKMSFWQKAGRGALNMVQGVFKIAENFIGFEDGKWNWKKCLKNVALAAVCVGATFIPVAGPFISAGLLTLGVGAGVYGVGKGIYKASKATTVDEFDKGFQDIGAGAFIGVTSAMGLRGMGKAFRVANPSSASSATSGSFAEGASNFARDMFINSFKSAKHTAIQDVGAIRAAGGGFKGFKATAKAKISDSWNKVSSKDEFEAMQTKKMNDLNSKIADIDAKLADPTLTAHERTLLQLQKDGLTRTYNQVSSAKTQSEWRELGHNSEASKVRNEAKAFKSKMSADGSVEINGVKFETQAQKEIFKNYINSLIKENKALNNEMNALYKLRIKSIRGMALRRQNYQTDLEAFAGVRNNRLSYIWSTIHRKDYGFKNLMDLLDLMYKPFRAISNKPGSGAFKLQEALTPTYVKYWLDTQMSEEEMQSAIAELVAQKNAIEQELTTVKRELQKA